MDSVNQSISHAKISDGREIDSATGEIPATAPFNPLDLPDAFDKGTVESALTYYHGIHNWNHVGAAVNHYREDWANFHFQVASWENQLQDTQLRAKGQQDPAPLTAPMDIPKCSYCSLPWTEDLDRHLRELKRGASQPADFICDTCDEASRERLMQESLAVADKILGIE